MIKFSSSMKLNAIHIVHSPFNKHPKNIFLSWKALMSGERQSENLGKIGNNRDICCYANLRVVSLKENIGTYPLVPKSL